MPPYATSKLRLGLLALLFSTAACHRAPEVDPRYRPAENVLEVVSVLRQHIPDDTYRFQPARDFTGRNVYRSSLLRLESVEAIHADALRNGHMEGVITFSKGRALERLRAYDLAAEQYRLAAEQDEVLEIEALRSADVCDALDAVIQIGARPPPDQASEDTAALAADKTNAAPAADKKTPALAAGKTDLALAEFERRVSLLEDLAMVVSGTHHYYIVQEEIERADIARAQYFAGRRKVVEDGNVRAVAEIQRVIVRHPDSKNLNRRLLSLADLYTDLAVEYADVNPPEGLSFDPARFQELIDAGTNLYEMVANQDGTLEKLEASRRLEAFLAFALSVDNDRFTP